MESLNATYKSSIVTVPSMNYIALIREFMEQQGYALDISDQRPRHEIYLSDVRKVSPEKLKTGSYLLTSPKKLYIIKWLFLPPGREK